ncbi:MAG: hypothetical protein GWP08_14945 [Nitrospiraceae bacterium]|nr:hypothetical protein [Nitrospiraceae bacterium]
MHRAPPQPATAQDDLRAWPVGRGMVADIPALLRLRHRCEPRRCADGASCCQAYEVCLSPCEVDRLAGLMPACIPYAPGLKDPTGYINPFECVGQRLFAIEEDEDGLCVFGYRSPGGGMRCAVHSAALDLGLDPDKTKPRSCALWPLSLGTSRPRFLTIQDDAYAFSCNRRRSATVAALDGGVAAIVTGVFGVTVLRAIERGIAALRDG